MKIAFIDSGIGGLSVVKKAYEKKGGEFIYYADSDYMPYGALTERVLSDHIAKVVQKLAVDGAGVIVLACNTATAVCIDALREKFRDLVFVGTEPAVKPALCFDGDVLVLATPLTLAQRRFSRLLVSDKAKAFYTPDCSRLAYLVERDFPYLEKAERELDKIIAPYLYRDIGSVVIGCTHYAYLEEYIKRRYTFNVVSGAGGVVRQLYNVAPEECFGNEKLLLVRSGDEKEQKLLEERARLICGALVAPL